MTPPPRPDSIPPKWNANSTRSQKVILYKEDTKTGTNPSQLRRMTPQKMKEMKQNSQKPTKKAKTKKKHTKRNVLLVFILLLLVGGGIAAWQLGLLKGFGIGGSSSDGDDLLSYSPDYECIVDEDEIDDIVEKYGFPETTKDNSPLFGTYSGDLDEAGVSITLDVPDGDDDRIVAVYYATVDDVDSPKGVCCYCGNSIYAVYQNADDVGGSPNFYFFAKSDGHTICFSDNENWIEMELEE